MLNKTLATGAVVLASAGVLLTASPAAAHVGTWTSNHGSDVSGNLAYINGLENVNAGCGNSNAVLGKSLGSCYNAGIIIQD
ncbi:hypothetical protein [Nocardiopsis halotolerans]|uniref:hypothetical protein n=1 Tax=Nocardiopsis halotolerans TaxID=124252 RepID=UPI0004780215|nr:hypothetical protein [Nocardiopsis halotolerans]